MRGLGTFERLLQQSREGTARAMLLSADVQLLAERSITMERAARQFLVLQDQALRTRFDDAARDAEQALGRMSVSGAMTDDVLAWRGQLGRIRGQLRQPEAASAADATLADAFRNLDDLNRRLNLQTRLLIEGQSDHLLTGLEKGRERFARHVLIAFLVSILLALGLGLWLARPLKRLERAVDGLGANLLDQPVVIRGPADVRSLGRRLDWLRLRLRELDADKARFLRHVSHELKTPLASLREGVSLLEDGVAGELSERQREVTRIIRQQTLALQEQIEGLLRFNAAAFAASEIHPERFALHALIHDVVGQQRLHWAARALEVRVEGPEVLLLADPDKLSGALGNLLSNAVRFSPESGVVTLRTARQGGQVVIDVTDEGPGIAEADRERVFEPFFRGQIQPEEGLRGTGIGLSIVKEYVTALGGRIMLLPSPRGAHFRLELPHVE